MGASRGTSCSPRAPIDFNSTIRFEAESGVPPSPDFFGAAEVNLASAFLCPLRIGRFEEDQRFAILRELERPTAKHLEEQKISSETLKKPDALKTVPKPMICGAGRVAEQGDAGDLAVSPLVPPGLALTNLELEVLSTLRNMGQEATGRATSVDTKSPRVQRTRQAARTDQGLGFPRSQKQFADA